MNIIPHQEIEEHILTIRATKVILDSDIAILYGVETKRINEAVKNNPDKFPDDFMFEVDDNEFYNLKSKFSTTKFSKTRTNPKAFREQGVYMLATILKSKKATETTISIMRAFTKMREFATGYMSLFQKIQMLEVDNDKKFTKVNEHLNNIYTLLEEIIGNPKELDENIMGFIKDKQDK